MRKIILTISALGILGFVGYVLAAPTSTYQRNIYPEANSTYELGTSTKAWKNITTDKVCLNGDCQTGWPSAATNTFTNLTVTGTSTINTMVATTGIFSVLDSGTVIVFSSSTGLMTFYKATANTDAARGVALVNAFTAAGVGDSITIGPGAYLPATVLTLKTAQNLVLQGSYIYQTTTTKNIFNIINANWATISGGGRLVGVGKTGTSVSSTVGNGIYTGGVDIQLKITGLNIEGFSSGIYLNHANGAGAGTTDYYNAANISDCHIKFNDYGVYWGDGVEYNIISGSQLASNTVAIRLYSGNALIDGNNIDYNDTAIKIEAGGNDGHGIISNNNINHSQVLTFDVGPLINGMTVSNNHIFTCLIKLNGTGGFNMSGGICNIPSFSLYGTSTKYNTISRVWFSEGAGNVVNYGAASNLTYLRFEQNKTLATPSSSLDVGIGTWHGGTGSILVPSVSEIMHGDGNGAYTITSSFQRNFWSGQLLNYGSGDIYNTFGNFSIHNNYKDNIGLVIKAASSTMPAAVQPNTISGLKFWFKADALVLANGASVATWTDSSGNGLDATGAGVLQPTYVTNVLNGQPVVRFNGGNYLLTASATGTQPITVFLVSKQANVVNRGYGKIPFAWNGGKPMIYGNQAAYTSGRWYSGSDVNFTSPDVNTWILYNGLASSTGSSIAVNNGTPTTGDAGASNPNGTMEIGGMNTNTTTYGYIGDIAELIVYNGALTNFQKDGVVRYLQKKYALPITDGSSDPSSAQVANLQEWQNNAGTPLSAISPTGAFCKWNGGSYTMINFATDSVTPIYTTSSICN